MRFALVLLICVGTIGGKISKAEGDYKKLLLEPPSGFPKACMQVAWHHVTQPKIEGGLV